MCLDAHAAWYCRRQCKRGRVVRLKRNAVRPQHAVGAEGVHGPSAHVAGRGWVFNLHFEGEFTHEE